MRKGLRHMNVRPLVNHNRRALAWIGQHRLTVGIALLSLAAMVTLSWFVSLATSPARRAGAPVLLDAYGRPGVEVRVIHPTRLSVDETGERAARVIFSARALASSAIAPIELVFPLPDDAVAFVDADGNHIPGRIRITPGYPNALPHNLRLAHGNTQLQGGLLFPYQIRIVPLLLVDEGTTAVPELAFGVRLESVWEQSLRTFAVGMARYGTLYFVLLVLVVVAVGAGQRVRRRRVLAREKHLATIYGQLSEHVKLERWNEARQLIESIRNLQPHYRDIDRLDTMVTSAEMAVWRREQLYQIGAEAYRARNWPSAVQAFGTIEEETPYYREVRFLQRTAALYADLASRDRSRRTQAAQELGEIADLIDMTPLVHALGDRSEEVANAAEDALRRIGADALDVLLSGLTADRSAARERCFRLIQGMGQAVRPSLLGALRSADPRLTAPIASLLASLGAREELADALLVAPEPHQEGIVEALLSEGMAASNALIGALLRAPAERQQTIINALAALKLRVELDRRIDEAIRSTRDPAARELLQRAQRAPGAPFRVAGDAPPMDVQREATETHEERDERTGSRVLRLFDRRPPFSPLSRASRPPAGQDE
jgi:hypothetical protein